MITFNHFNFNVLNLEKSLAFYKEALGLEPDGHTDFTLELTWLKDRTKPYDLGECEFHLAFHVDEYEELFKKHQEMGCVCFVNEKMGVYFITDPDGYWIEIIPRNR